MVPNKLSYVELFPKQFRYNMEKQLSKTLRQLVQSGPARIRQKAASENVREKIIQIASPSVVNFNIINCLKENKRPNA